MDQVILLAERHLAERIPFGAFAQHFSSFVVAPLRFGWNAHAGAPRLNAGGISILSAQQTSAMDTA